jgi:hypothetical protein
MSYAGAIAGAKIQESLPYFTELDKPIIWAIWYSQDDPDGRIHQKFDRKHSFMPASNNRFIFDYMNSQSTHSLISIPQNITEIIRYNSRGDLEGIDNIQNPEALCAYIEKDNKLLFERLTWAKQNARNPKDVTELKSLINQQAMQDDRLNPHDSQLL